MTRYPDASVVVSAFTDEIASTIAADWLSSIEPGGIVTSAWCETQVASALALKVRTGALAPDARRPLFELIRATLADTASKVAVEYRHFEAATALLNRSNKALRGGDALHLAIAADAGAILCTLDRRMAEAGQALGLSVDLLS